MLGMNMKDSEKLIGKTNAPLCFRCLKWWPLDYREDKNECMTGQLFEE